MNRPLRVLFVITSLDRGGAQRQIVDLSARLRASGWPVTVLSMTRPAEYVDELLALGVKVVSLRLERGRPTPLAYVRYGRFVRGWRPDIIHGHMVHANLLVRVGRIFAPRIPVVCTVHNVNEGARWRELAYRLTDPLATLTTAVSEAAAKRYVEIHAAPKGRIEAFPNGLDFSRPIPTDARSRVRDELGVGEAFLWVTAGRLDPQKGYDLLLDAMDRVRRVQPEARLVIAGHGPERASLDGQLGRLDLATTVTLLGDRPDVPALLAAADGFVLSSRWEGLPMVLLEAAAQAVPIVCTDVGGDREVVRPELGGVLVDVDPAAISDGMLAVMEMTPEDRATVGHALQSHVRSNYDMTVVTHRWKTVYARITAGNAASKTLA